MRLLKFLLFISVFALSLTLIGQNSGYAGKRVALNLDVLSGTEIPRFGGSVEYLLGRHSTVSLGFSIYNQNIDQSYSQSQYRTQVIEPTVNYYENSSSFLVSNIPERDYKKDLEDQGRIQTKTIELKYSYYMNNTFPAPRGAFMAFALQSHTSTVTGNYFKSLTTELEYYEAPMTGKLVYHYEPDEYYEYTYGSVQSFGLMAGAGYTYFITDYLNVSASAYLHYVKINYNEEYNDRVLSGAMDDNFGQNIINSNSVFNDYNTNTFGVSASLKVGYLIF